MRITESQLRRIIRKEIHRTLTEKTLRVSRGTYGPSIEDDQGEYFNFGGMVAELLLDLGENDIFKKSPRVDPAKALANLMKSHKAGIQGGMQNWDTDVFSNNYDVDYDKVIEKYASAMGYTVEEGEQDYDRY